MAKSKRFEPISRPLSDIPASHPERDALLRAILDNPSDDTPRLVYADWQEENGQPEHAQLIRVQCELYRLDTSTAAGKSRCRSLQYKERKLLDSMAHLWPEQLSGGNRPHNADRGLFGYSAVSLTTKQQEEGHTLYSWTPQKNCPAPELPFDRVCQLNLTVYPSGVAHLPALRDAGWLRWI